MKMADESVLLQNNCASINRNGAEAEKSGENVDAPASDAIINKTTSGNENRAGKTAEDAVDAFLAGENKCDAEEEEEGLFPEEGMSFKVAKSREFHNDHKDHLHAQENEEEDKHFNDKGGRYMVKSLKKRSIKW